MIKYTSVYGTARNIGKEVRKHLSTYLNIVDSIGYSQVCSGANYRSYGKLYKLNYEIFFGGVCTHTSLYAFSRKKLLLFKKVLRNATEECLAYSNKLVDELDCSDAIKEEIRKHTSLFGFRKPEIVEVSDTQKEKMYEVERVNPRLKRIAEYEVRANSCPRCGGGGCPLCEPQFFC